MEARLPSLAPRRRVVVSAPPDLVIELCPYGFKIRVEVNGSQARVLADDGTGWEDVGEARLTKHPAATRPRHPEERAA